MYRVVAVGAIMLDSDTGRLNVDRSFECGSGTCLPPKFNCYMPRGIERLHFYAFSLADQRRGASPSPSA